MPWRAPKILELPIGMEINMYACAGCSALAKPTRRINP
jgi:coenzyme PQQ precursor peptide PqqA